jgi:transcriptional regulator with XRE-family HTH domain
VVRLLFSQDPGYVLRMALTADTLADRILKAIEASGLTHAALAEAIDLDPTALSKALSGKRNFKPLEVALISECVGVPVQDLLADGDPQASARAAVAGRVQPDSNPAVDDALARVAEILELDRLLRDVGSRSAPMPYVARPRHGQPYQQGERLAERVRVVLGAGDTDLPTDIGVLAATLEDTFSIDIAIEPLPPGLDGLAVTREQYRLIMVSSTIPAHRQRFTLAHELGHLVAGDGSDVIDESITAQSSAKETRANAFAAAFLMPAAALRSAFVGTSTATEQLVADLLSRYRVSLDALAFRLHNVGLINAGGRDAVRRMSSARIGLRLGRTTDLQARRDRRLPEGVLDRAVEAYVRGQISIRPIATFMQMDAETLLDELSPPRLPPVGASAIPADGDQLVPML